MTKQVIGGSMLERFKRSRSSLLVLLFAAAMGPPACTTGPDAPEEELDTLEASEVDNVSDGSENFEDLEVQGDDAQFSDENFEENMDEGTVSLGGKTDLQPLVATQVAPLVKVETFNRGVSTSFVGGIAGQAFADGLPEAGSKMAYIVQKGDTLGKIAQRIFSDKNRWRELASASSFRNPNLIYPGDLVFYQLDQSSLAFAKKYEELQKKEFVVRSGDTLRTLAQKLYGDQGQWEYLWRLNDHIQEPDDIQVGMVLYYVSPQALMSLDKTDYTQDDAQSHMMVSNRLDKRVQETQKSMKT